jgi:universal stress protein E
MDLKNVVVVIEPNSETQPALEKVLVLSRYQSFDVTLVSCDYTQYLVEGYYFDAVDLPSLRAEYIEERKQMLESLAEPLRKQGLGVTTHAIWGHPSHEAIIDQAGDADLVIVHTRRHGALSRMFLTNDDWQLVRCCPAPLLLVKEKPWKSKPIVLAAVDPLHSRHKPLGLDHKILNVSEQINQWLGGDVHVLHSYSQMPLSGTYLKDAEKEHRAAFSNLLAEFDIATSRQHLIEEAAEFALQKMEQELQADVVVMGGISRSFVSDIFIGNTTEKVLDYIECDVLVLKLDGFKSPLDKDRK